MRAAFSETVELARSLTGRLASRRGDDFGAFLFRRNSIPLRVIASSGSEDVPWDHVSVSTAFRCPTWDEMAWVKNLFFDEEETVVQFHPPKSQYVNFSPYCLHLWRPHGVEIRLPPTIAVGPLASEAPATEATP